MKLLIITQKVDRNDPVLGFFHRWIEEFAAKAEKVFVICLYEGVHDLPDNVEVYSLGKDLRVSRLRYVTRFYVLLWKLRGRYDGVFVHMNQVYVLLGGIFWKIMRKPVGLWYVHRAKTLSLWVAEKFVDVVFTSLKNSFTLATEKSLYLGHGIDVATSVRPRDFIPVRDPSSLLCVGRLTPIKDQKTIIRACGILSRSGRAFHCTFIGAAAASGDAAYNNELHDLVEEEGIGEKISFVGSLPPADLPPYYWQNDIHVNACPTGGLDKVVIEGMLGGAIPVVVNEAFRDTLGEYASRLLFREGDAADLARCIEELLDASDKEKIRADLEKKARETFDLAVLVKKIINWYETSR